jgi:hypothetical protein
MVSGFPSTSKCPYLATLCQEDFLAVTGNSLVLVGQHGLRINPTPIEKMMRRLIGHSV